jgi:hypothetical protein
MMRISVKMKMSRSHGKTKKNLHRYAPSFESTTLQSVKIDLKLCCQRHPIETTLQRIYVMK